jgi:hypothetical protein
MKVAIRDDQNNKGVEEKVQRERFYPLILCLQEKFDSPSNDFRQALRKKLEKPHGAVTMILSTRFLNR